MLDKLLDNATGFAPPQSEIHLILSSSEKSILIAIENKGPLLPTTMQHQLFDNMVSVRDTQAIKQGTHLGLGLHIVRLISEYHQGSVKAENLPDKSGVRFTIQLPNPSLSS
jgi:K+-sensing histidine kinase KdpD